MLWLRLFYDFEKEYKLKKSDGIKEYKRMTETPVFKLVATLSVPTTISVLISSIYNFADTYFVSGIGNAATGAVSIVYSIQAIIQAIGFGFGMGAQSLISRKLGEKKNKEASLYATSAFAAAFFMGLLITGLGFINLPFVMYLFGSTKTVLPLACDYGKWILIGAPLFCSSFVLNNILRSQGKATLSMVGLCSGGIINIGLDALLIRQFNMGVEGAAIATIISQAISFSILISFFISGKSIVSINPFHASRKFKDYWKIFYIGLPTVFRQSLGSIATTLLNITVRPYGDAVLSAVSIANKIYLLLRNMLIGVGQGFQPVAGYNYGTKNYKRVRKAFYSAVAIGTVFCFGAAALLLCCSGDLMAIFRKGDTEVINIGGKMLKILAISMPVLGFSTFVNQLYQSLGYVWQATFLASCRQGIFFVPLILILPHFSGLTGIQSTQAIADLATCVVSVPFILFMMRKYLSDKI